MLDSIQPPALVIFDLGGTTIRDRGEVPAAFAGSLEASGLAVEPGAITEWRGASKREVLSHLVADQRPALEDTEREALVAIIYRHFCTMLTQRLRTTRDLAFPDARVAFERLHDAGICVALNSGFDRSIVDVILTVAGWPKDLVDAVVCGDEVSAGRPAPFMIFRSMEQTGVYDVGRVAVVGDTRLDLEAGANAGVAYRIGVLTGAHDRATLDRAPHTHLLESVGVVPDLWL
ncbi:MAG: HAD hydrolase-like protein [Acidobacteria bacterium]|nr:HAD hydrolase-like protein [Acidobacteriota bacterium]